MDINIRESIKNNFKDSSINDIKNSIEEAIEDKDDITLPGMGAFFEILWINSNDDEKAIILENIKKGI